MIYVKKQVKTSLVVALWHIILQVIYAQMLTTKSTKITGQMEKRAKYVWRHCAQVPCLHFNWHGTLWVNAFHGLVNITETLYGYAACLIKEEYRRLESQFKLKTMQKSADTTDEFENSGCFYAFLIKRDLESKKKTVWRVYFVCQCLTTT